MKNTYTQGQHYSQFLTITTGQNSETRVTKVTKTNYGYCFQMFNNWVTLFYGKLIINEDGTAKMKMKVDKNYRPVHYYTTYFDDQGREIVTIGNSTRKELSIYKSIRAAKLELCN